MNPIPDKTPNEAELDAIEAVAATWLGRRDRGLTPEEAVEFARWRTSDSRHESAVGDLSAMWSALDDLSALPQPATTTANAGITAEENVVSPVVHFPRRSLGWVLALAACLTFVLGTVAWQRRNAAAATTVAHYETVVGDQRTVTLTDGSTLQLNTHSAVDVHYTRHERRLELLRGEAYFAVTKDPARPFIVASGGVEARAVGTAFTVRQREKETELVVTEGRVKFSSATPGPAAVVEVSAGHLAVCDPLRSERPRVAALDEAELARTLAWKAGRLVFRTDMPLAEAAAEFNRYHVRQLVMRNAETGAVPVGGAFEIANLDSFVRMLETSFDITVVERDAQRIVLGVKH